MKTSRAVVAFFCIFVGLTGCGTMNHDGAHEGHEAHTTHQETSATQPTQATWAFVNGSPTANRPASLMVTITDEAGKPVQDFDVTHEKLLHLIVVREDLNTFDHIHPTYAGDGRFVIDMTFPSQGKYRLFADAKPKGMAAKTYDHTVTVEGTETSPAPMDDGQRTKVVDGVQATIEQTTFVAKKEATLRFTLADASTKQPITTLEPYLGAIGHVVIISGDTKTYLHVHPISAGKNVAEAAFHTTFPTEGMYKVWAQFQYLGKVRTFSYWIEAT